MVRIPWWKFRRGVEPPTHVDLAEDVNAVLALMLKTDEWRIRSVEQLALGSARFCIRRRSLQAAPLSPTLAPVAGAKAAYVALPIERLPKAPLVAYDVKVDEKPAYVVPRGATAALEAEFVCWLATLEGIEADENVRAYIRAICEFTPWPWKRVRRDRLSGRRAMLKYLQEGLAPMVLPTPPKHVSWIEALVTALAARLAVWLLKHFPSLRGRWAWVKRPTRDSFSLTSRDIALLNEDARFIGGEMRRALGEGRSRTSSADNPLLAAPLLAQRGEISSLEDLQRVLERLREFVESLRDRVEHPRDSAALRALADFGRRWETFVWCEVPLDRPFVVETQRQVPFRIAWPGGWAVQQIALKDARSNHVTIRVLDENVEMGKAQLRGLDGEKLEHTFANGLARSEEHYALYASEADRDPRATVRVQLKVARSVWWSSAVIQLIAWLSVGVTGYLGYEQRLSAADLAVFVVPTTLGASFALTRERTSLARRLTWGARLGTGLALATLWACVAYIYFAGGHMASG